MKVTKTQLRRIIKEVVMDNISLTRQDEDLSGIAEHFGYILTKRENVIRQHGPQLEPLGPDEYEIIDPQQESGLRLIAPDFSVSKYYNFGKWMYAVKMKGRDMYLGPMRTIERVIEYIEGKL
jgi:hypothetical protein